MTQKPKKMLILLAQTTLGIAMVPALVMLIGGAFHVHGLEALVLVSVIMLLTGIILRIKAKRFSANVLLLGGIISLILATLNTVIPLILALCLGIYLALRKVHNKAKAPEQSTLQTVPTVLSNKKTTYLIRNITLDLTNTMLKDGETELSIRGMVGNAAIWIPYDTEICVSTTSLVGKTTLLGKAQTYNRTENYDNARRKLKIKISVLLGDIEVKYI